MSMGIAGTGWVTPLGSGIDEVWQRLMANHQPDLQEIRDPLGEKAYPTYRVPAAALKHLPPHPRLRRSSAISRFAAASGLAAMADANLTDSKNLSSRLALIFAVANGGVIYTRRFYSDIVNAGADAASPLLFPETVFNAAASHLAAILGLTGASYTLVGDGSIGLTALKMADDLLSATDLEYCLIVAAEEADWLLCDAYQKWRLLRSAPPVEVYAGSRGTILSEGAGAVVIDRNGPVQMVRAAAGLHFAKRQEAPAALAKSLTEVGTPRNAVIVGSGNGTFIDEAELAAVSQTAPEATIYSPKTSLGEGVAASSLWQVIVAIEILRRQQLPQPQHPATGGSATRQVKQTSECTEITVLSCGLNQQAGAVRLVRRP